MPNPRLTAELIAAAIDGYEAQKSRLDVKIAELRQLLDGGRSEIAAAPEPAKRKRRRMSAAGRRAIAKAQRKRWAEAKKATEPAPQQAPKPKRKLSRAGRAAIIAATKRRWALKRAEAAKRTAKKAASPRKKAAATKSTVTKVAAKKTVPAAVQAVA